MSDLQGQYFTVASLPVPHPRSWLIPIGIGAIALVGCLVVLSTGSSNQFTPAALKPTPTQPPVTSPLPPSTPPPVSVPSQPQLVAAQPVSTNAQIGNCTRAVGANLRRYPSLDKSAISLVIPCGQPLTVTGDSVRSDGVTWLGVRYQQSSGWVASELIQRN